MLLRLSHILPFIPLHPAPLLPLSTTTTTGFYSQVLRLYFPGAGTLSCTVCLTTQLFLLVYPHANVGLPSPPTVPHPVHQPPPRLVFQVPPLWPWSSSCCLAESPPYPSWPSPPLLLVWMTVSSLTPRLSDFHTVRFSGSSGWFLFLNLLLSFWLSKEAQCIYLRFHLGQKSVLSNIILY